MINISAIHKTLKKNALNNAFHIKTYNKNTIKKISASGHLNPQLNLHQY